MPKVEIRLAQARAASATVAMTYARAQLPVGRGAGASARHATTRGARPPRACLLAAERLLRR